MRGDMRTVERQQRKWGTSIAAAAGLEVAVEGAHLVDPARPYVVVSNHVSALDPVVLFAALPIGVTYVAKRELLGVPVFGPIIARTGAIFIDRHDSARSHAAMDDAAQRVRDGQSVLVFAEGTRSRTGKLKPFKKGGFVLAIAAQVEVLPVSLCGVFEKLPPGGVVPRPGKVTVKIHAPVATAGMGYGDRDGLAERVRAAIEGGLGQNSRQT
jgi:1-acyl-sn-glycerol-3-phosphate acyltransferase